MDIQDTKELKHLSIFTYEDGDLTEQEIAAAKYVAREVVVMLLHDHPKFDEEFGASRKATWNVKFDDDRRLTQFKLSLTVDFKYEKGQADG